MPGKVDEKHWNSAKEAAKKEGKAKDWPYIQSIYQKMIKAVKHPGSGSKDPRSEAAFRALQADK